MSVSIVASLRFSGGLKITEIMHKSDINCGVAKELVSELVRLSLVASHVNGSHTVYSLTAKGTESCKMFEATIKTFGLELSNHYFTLQALNNGRVQRK